MKYKIQFLENSKLAQTNKVAEYDENATYNTGDYTLYSSVVYKCKSDAVTGDWNSSKWDSTDLDSEFSWLEEALEKDGVLEDYEVVNISFQGGSSVVVLKHKEES